MAEEFITYAVTYEYPADSTQIPELRPRHREFLGELKAAGNLLGSGPYLDADGGALIILRFPATVSEKEVADLLDKDPFTQEGALTARKIRVWNPVLNVFPAPEV